VEHDANGMAITGEIKSSEVFDFSGDAGDVQVCLSRHLDATHTRTHAPAPVAACVC